MTRTTSPSLTLTIAALTLALAAPSTEARPSGRPPGPPPPLAHVVERHADELGLDAATLDAILALQEQDREAAQELRRSLEAARNELRALIDSDESTEAAVIAQVEALGALETRMHVARVRTDLAVRRLLSAEQLATLHSLRPPPPAEGERGDGRLGGRGGGPGGDSERGGRPQRGGFQRSN